MKNKRIHRVLSVAVFAVMLIAGMPLAAFGGQQKANETPAVQITYTDGEVSNNTVTASNDIRYGELDYAYLEPWGNGGWSRVEYLSKDNDSARKDVLVVENYDSSYVLQEQKIIDFRMSTGKLDNAAKMKEAQFGGVFLGESNNYVVIGWGNLSRDETKEVLRVIKYSKDWSRQIAHRSFYDLNSKRMFEAGSCRMTEKDGFLFIHTSHRMSKQDFNGHQASLTIRLNEDMKSDEDDRINCGTIMEMEGYVSHSFDQYAASDDDTVYFADLGDGAPRAVRLISRYGDENDGYSEHYADVLDIIGDDGFNETGVTLMDMKTSGGNVLLLGNTVDQSAYENIEKDAERTLFLAVGNAKLDDVRRIDLSDAVDGKSTYTYACLVNGQTDGELYLMWETGEAGAVDTTYLVSIDADGNVIGTRGFDDPYVIHAKLSRVKPVMSEDGKIVWYCTEDNRPYFVSVDTTRLQELDSDTGIPIDTCEAVYADRFSYVETGIPLVTSMKYGSYELAEFQDYEIEYQSYAQVGVNRAVIRGTGVFSGEIERTYTLLPNNPKNLEQTRGTATSITIKWDPVTEADGYEVSLYQDGTLVTSQKAGKNGSITLSKLSPQMTYQCKVRTYAMQGNKTYYSDYVQMTVGTAASGEAEKYNIANCCNIYVSKEVTFEEGKDAVPEVSLYYGQHRLREGYDYRLEYQNQSAIGTGLVIIIGLDEFNGTVVRDYAIVPKKQDENPETPPMDNDPDDDTDETFGFLTLTEGMAAGAATVTFEQGTGSTTLEQVMQLAPGEEVIYKVTPEVSVVYSLSYQTNSGYPYWRVYNQELRALYGHKLSSDIQTECKAALAAGRTYYFRFTNYQEQDAEFEWSMHWYPAENFVMERTKDTAADKAAMPIIYGNLTNGSWENGKFYFDVLREYYHYDPYVEYYSGGKKCEVEAMYTELSNNAAELQSQSLWSEGNTYPVTVNFGNVSAQMPVRIWGGIEYINSISQPEYYTLSEKKVIKPEEIRADFLYTAEKSGRYQFHLKDTGELVSGPEGTPDSIRFGMIYFDEYYNIIDDYIFSHDADSQDTPTEIYFELEKGKTYYMLVSFPEPDYGKTPEQVKKYNWEYSLAVQTDIAVKEFPDIYDDYVIPTWVYGDTESGTYEGDKFIFGDDMLRGQFVVWETYSSGIDREISPDDVTITSNQRQTPWKAETANADHRVTVSENGFEKTLSLSLNILTLVDNYLQEYAKNDGVLESVDADVKNRVITERDICLILNPKETKEYLLYGSDTGSNSNKKTAEATLYDENMQVIAESNQDKGHHYYLIRKKLQAGKTYYLRLVQNTYRSVNYTAGMVQTTGCQFRMLNTDYVDTLYYGSRSDGYWKDGKYYFSDERVRQLEMPMLISRDSNCSVPRDYLTFTWPKANGSILPGQTVSLSVGFDGWQASKKVRIADLKEYYSDYNVPVLSVGDNKQKQIWYFDDKEYNGCAFFDADTAGTYTFTSSETAKTAMSVEDTANGKVLVTGNGTVSCHLKAGQSCLLRLTPAAGTEGKERTITVTQKADSVNGGSDSGDSSDSSGDSGNNGGSSGGTSTTGQKRYKAGSAYYTGKLSSGKVAYAGPVKKTVTSVKVPATVKIKGKKYKVTTIASSAFKDCKKLKTVTIGSNITTIGEKSFYNCVSLTKVTIPGKVTTVKKSAFYNCKKLKTVTIGGNVKLIEERAFYNCISLTKVTIPGKVTTIKKEAFYKCKKLSSVTVKGTKLKTVGKNAFKGTKKKIKVTVPKSKYSSYKKILKKAGFSSPVYKKVK